MKRFSLLQYNLTYDEAMRDSTKIFEKNLSEKKIFFNIHELDAMQSHVTYIATNRAPYKLFSEQKKINFE
jgi:hypothetical protein